MVRRRDVLKTFGAGTAAIAIGPFVHARPARADKGELVIVGWGGSLVKAERKAYFEGFEKETGIKIKDDTPPTPAKLKTMVDSGNITWDIIETDLAAILTMRKDNLLETLDYSKLDKRALDAIYPATKLPDGVGAKIYSFNIVYNTKAFPTGKHPKSWPDMWDGTKFKGGRTMNFGGGVTPQLEIALLGDGVPKEKIYPMDVPRAYASMSKLKPLVNKWYGSHSEAIQLVTAGESAIACTVGPRAIAAKREGAPIDVEWNQGKISADHWCIVKGSKNRDIAHQFISYAIDAKRQAAMCSEVPYGPSNKKAVEFMKPAEVRELPSSPENEKAGWWWDAKWWGEVGQDGKTNRERETEKFAKWMVTG
jgi:putative spermidine/putrescine transport system substrate-binding protein